MHVYVSSQGRSYLGLIPPLLRPNEMHILVCFLPVLENQHHSKKLSFTM